MSRATAVLYDAPGPRARTFNLVFSLVAFALLGWLGWVVYGKFDETGQWESEKWTPFVHSQVWDSFLIPGIEGTLKAFFMGSLLSVVFGLVFAVLRMSPSRPLRWAAGTVIEFFRAIPLLILMMFIYFMQQPLGLVTSIYWAVVLGLMLYNGSVLAEVIRAGVNSLPKGQREAAMAIGLSEQQVLNTVLLPQAIRAMLPAIVAQLVVVLKDTALGYILAYEELLNQIPKIQQNYDNLLPAAMVVAGLFIVMNTVITVFATWLERFLSRSRHTAGPIAEHEDVLLSVPGAGMPGGGE